MPGSGTGTRRRLAVGAVTLLTLGAMGTLSAPGAIGAAPTTTQTAAVPGTEGTVAYVTDGDGDLEIYAVSPGGGPAVNLTHDPQRDQDPAWSPDGSRIAFASGRAGAHLDIWVMNANGSSPVNLTPLADSTGSGEAGIEPSWSPDGERIAYTYQGDVWVMSDDGGSKTNLTHDASLPAAGQMPAWSPDGERIAYVRGWDVWTMAPDGSDRTRLTSTTGGLGTEKHPDWSPDGLRIVYERSGQIWHMNADGSGQTVVSAGADRGGTRPAWSPEGDRIVFSSSGYSAANGPDLFVVRPDGTGAQRLDTEVPAADADPAWQPTATTARPSTYTRLAVAVSRRIKVSGELFNANPGLRMRVTLLRKAAGTFKPLSTTRPILGTYGDYRTSFAAPRKATRCRVVVRFPGGPDALASKRSRTFAC